MNVSIDAKGELAVMPDNNTESYALKCWYDNWMAKNANASLRIGIVGVVKNNDEEEKG